MKETVENVIILGCGAAAHTAAIYAARASLAPLVLGNASGTYVDVAPDMPGFPQGLDANALLGAMKAQAERFGARYEAATTISIRSEAAPFEIESDEHRYRAHSLILAEGTLNLKIGTVIPKSANERGAAGNISGAALCPGAMDAKTPMHMILAAAEGCQASIETERALQERGVTSAEQRTESW